MAGRGCFFYAFFSRCTFSFSFTMMVPENPMKEVKHMRVTKSVRVNLQWNTFTLPIKTGTPVSKTGEMADNNSAVGIIMQQVNEVSLDEEFYIMTGGEPLVRKKDVIRLARKHQDCGFVIFTNGTLIGPSYIEFLKKHLNMIPVISIEGMEHSTDERRGTGMYKRAMMSVEMLHKEDLFFGTSITVTTENFQLVTSDAFVDNLRQLGCKMIIYVEYVPTEPGTEYLAFGEADLNKMETVQQHQKKCFDDMIIISFPGDEQHMGGCLAAGRGFFHIGPDGSAEPCPFSPFSDSKVTELGILGALASPLFRKLKEVHLVGGEHSGGCALYEHREEVEAMLKQ